MREHVSCPWPGGEEGGGKCGQYSATDKQAHVHIKSVVLRLGTFIQ